jgi:hypothetical protein
VAKKSKTKRPPARRPIPASKLTGGPKKQTGKYHFGTLRGSDQAVQGLLLSGKTEPDLMVELLPPLLWLSWADGMPGNLCVNSTMTLHHAYEQLGITAQPRAVDLVVRNERTHHTTMYGRPDPYWEGTTFHGHAVLWLPRSGRFCDATVEQYPEVRRYRLGPIVGRTGGTSANTPEQRTAAARGELPPGSVLAVKRHDLMLMYTAVEQDYANALTDGVAAHDHAYRRTGINLVSQALLLWRMPEIVDRIRQAPYPRLHALLDAIGNAKPTVDDDGDIRFLFPTNQYVNGGPDHAESGELALRLDELPLPDDLPDPATLPRLRTAPELPSAAEIRKHSDPAAVRNVAEDVRTEARTMLTGDQSTGGGGEPVIVFEPLQAIGVRRGGITTEMQADSIVQAAFGRCGPGRVKPPHLPHWSIRRTSEGLELWDESGIWARAAHTPDPAWLDAAQRHGRVRVIYGVRTGVRTPAHLNAEDYTDAYRAAELIESRRQGIVAIATIPWPPTT